MSPSAPQLLTNQYPPVLTELLFDKTDEFIGIYDLTNERYTRVNRAGVQLLGFASEADLLNDPVRARSVRRVPLSTEAHRSLLNQLIAAGTHQEQTDVQRQDGKTFWGQLTMNVFRLEERPYALVRLVDQGRLHRAERALEHSDQRNEAIFSSATIGIIVCNRAGQIISANRMADQLFGYPVGNLIRHSIDELVPNSVSRYHEKLRQSFNEHPQVRSMGHNRDLHAQRQDGTVFPVEISLSYFQLDDELYVVAYVVDITAKKEAERQLLTHQKRIEQLNADLEQKVADRTHALMSTMEQLERSKDELARALAAERELGELKSRFVAMASHEFRTPLTAILTSATLIEKYPDTNQQDKRQKHLNRVRASVNHLNDILEEFLSLGRLEEGRIEAHPTQVTLADVVAGVVADMRGTLKPGQTIVTDLNCPALVWLDASLLRKILVNLLANALKYSGPNQPVTVRGSCVNTTLTLVIADRGIGISPDDQEHLFELFFRAKNATNMPGTGLGLHIVDQYVGLMGGSIRFESALNEGTTFTIILPYENHPAH